MPADGISLPPKRDFGTSRWGGSKVRLHQRRHRPEGGMTAYGRYCCKSPKLPGDVFPAVSRSDLRAPVCAASITLPRSPVSLSVGDEVPHIFTRKSRLQPGKFLITSAKRLLQHNLHFCDMSDALTNVCNRGWVQSVNATRLVVYRRVFQSPRSFVGV